MKFFIAALIAAFFLFVPVSESMAQAPTGNAPDTVPQLIDGAAILQGAT